MDVKSFLLLLSANLALCAVTSSDESRGDGDSRGGDDFRLFALGPSDVGQMSRPMLRPSQTHGVFSFPYREDNYLYFPKQRDLKSARLHNILGSSFDPFWMSVKRPSGSTTGDTGPLATRSSDVRNAATAAGRKLHAAARALNFTVLTDSGAAVTATEATVAFMTRWLLQKAECGIASSWHDLGSVFWPRWIRRSHCEESGGGGGGCSWPAGMSCAPAQSTHIKILAWHCYALRSASVDGQPPLQKCSWRLVPYPIVTACTCGCGKHSTGHGGE